MAVDTLPALLNTLTESLTSASASLCSSAQLTPPTDGISLLDTKNELFLQYLHNLVFLIILKLRDARSPSNNSKDASTAPDKLSDAIVKQLVSLRVYLERGVKPLESRLRYQIDKVIRAADDAELRKIQGLSVNGTSKSKKKGVNGTKATGSDSESDASDSDASEPEIDPLSYRPNPAAFLSESKSTTAATSEPGPAKDAPYRPPRITATTMPTARRSSPPTKPQKSAHLDEFIATEFSSAPVAEPNVGSTIREGGRRTKSDAERREDLEKRDYEETNFVRLPGLSKKDKKAKGRPRETGWGGEEWRGLGEGADRIGGLVGRKRGAGAALERSRKRAVEDGPRDEGRMGERFEKRRRVTGGRRR
ncbi:MAG: hypothetical protein MMC23_009234 [Stictis urceolatum]|nr:hypothetical protein [Stictis urceolata]